MKISCLSMGVSAGNFIIDFFRHGLPQVNRLEPQPFATAIQMEPRERLLLQYIPAGIHAREGRFHVKPNGGGRRPSYNRGEPTIVSYGNMPSMARTNLPFVNPEIPSLPLAPVPASPRRRGKCAAIRIGPPAPCSAAPQAAGIARRRSVRVLTVIQARPHMADAMPPAELLTMPLVDASCSRNANKHPHH